MRVMKAPQMRKKTTGGDAAGGVGIEEEDDTDVHEDGEEDTEGGTVDGGFAGGGFVRERMLAMACLLERQTGIPASVCASDAVIYSRKARQCASEIFRKDGR